MSKWSNIMCWLKKTSHMLNSQWGEVYRNGSYGMLYDRPIKQGTIPGQWKKSPTIHTRARKCVALYIYRFKLIVKNGWFYTELHISSNQTYVYLKHVKSILKTTWKTQENFKTELHICDNNSPNLKNKLQNSYISVK